MIMFNVTIVPCANAGAVPCPVDPNTTRRPRDVT